MQDWFIYKDASDPSKSIEKNRWVSLRFFLERDYASENESVYFCESQNSEN